MTTQITGISSMATRGVLADLAAHHEAAQAGRVTLAIESVGGVDAARRVQGGEVFDLVFLAADAIDRLIEAGRLVPGSRVDLVRSGVAVAVPAGAPQPDISTEAALRAAVLAARTVGYSTGPSGVALLQQFERWGLTAALQGRLVQAPPGVPVGRLVAQGEVALGFQQLSELLGVDGIDLLGPLPDAVQITTTFSAGLGVGATQPEAARAFLAALAAPKAAAIMRRHGMTPA
jgi:molybdate transport system substrate-binding protein